MSKLKLLIILILIILINSCISPIVITYENKYSKQRKSKIKILPLYGDANQIYYYQYSLPVISDFNMDEQYMLHINDPNLLKNPEEERYKVFYLIISTSF